MVPAALLRGTAARRRRPRTAPCLAAGLLAWGFLAAAWLACEPRVEEHPATGVVRELQPDLGQAIVQHDEIPGLMPAMTMNFEVAPELLARMQEGQAIEFRVVFDGHSYRITQFSPREDVGGEAGDASGLRVEDVADERDEAPFFALVDQDRQPLALTQLRGKAVVIEFVFANCPGPCPALTSRNVRLQRMLTPELRDETWFVSITLDPERDTPEALRSYAEARGVDFGNWSLLTGPSEEVARVVRSYGVGTLRGPDGNIEHLVATFLVDPRGRIAHRYLGLDHDPEEMLADLEGLLS